MLRIRVEIDINEVDGKETSKLNGRPPQLVLRGHVTKKEHVVLEQGEKSVLVSYEDLVAAIDAFGVAHNLVPDDE